MKIKGQDSLLKQSNASLMISIKSVSIFANFIAVLYTSRLPKIISAILQSVHVHKNVLCLKSSNYIQKFFGHYARGPNIDP